MLGFITWNSMFRDTTISERKVQGIHVSDSHIHLLDIFVISLFRAGTSTICNYSITTYVRLTSSRNDEYDVGGLIKI